MSVEDSIMYLNYGAVAFAFLAAGFWFWSTVIPLHNYLGVGWGGDTGELSHKVRSQSKRSAAAAACAGFAAVCQGIALALKTFL